MQEFHQFIEVDIVYTTGIFLVVKVNKNIAYDVYLYLFI